MKPKFKDFFPVIIIDNETLQIGDEPGNAFEIYDPDKLILKVLPLLNGENDIETIHKNLNTTDVPISDLKELIDSLDEIGLIDISSSNNNELTDKQRIRYKNNLNYFNVFSRTNLSKEIIQKKLINTKVLVLGMGGVG